MTINLAPDLLDTLHAEAARAAPDEACGILLGRGNQIDNIQPARNVHSMPETHFEIDPQTLIDAHRVQRSGGAEIVGYFHSHPNGPPEPSATDQAMAPGDGRVWAIIGEGQVRFFRDVRTGTSCDADGGFEPLSYTANGG